MNPLYGILWILLLLAGGIGCILCSPISGFYSVVGGMVFSTELLLFFTEIH